MFLELTGNPWIPADSNTEHIFWANFEANLGAHAIFWAKSAQSKTVVFPTNSQNRSQIPYNVLFLLSRVFSRIVSVVPIIVLLFMVHYV